MGVCLHILHTSTKLKNHPSQKHITNMTEQTTSQRQNTPADLRASLIAATVDVVTGVCWLRDEDGVAREYRGDDTVGVVTWAGREWQGEEVRG